MTRSLLVLLGLVVVAAPAFAQQRTITGRVTSEQGAPLSGVSVTVKGTTTSTATTPRGDYPIAATAGQVLQFRLIGTALAERSVSTEDVINVQLRRVALDLDAVVVTALGENASARSLGTAQQSVRGAEIAQTQRENFFNALSGRVAGVDVTSTSGVPGASSSIVIRGISSISSSNQPLIIVDGLPIETRTVLKGPEAAALYGIDAANGAIVIKTKRGRAGGGMTYSTSMRIEKTGGNYQLQHVYGPTSITGGTLGSFKYFGDPYPAGTPLFD